MYDASTFMYFIYIGAFIARIDTSSQHLDLYVFDSHNLEKKKKISMLSILFSIFDEKFCAVCRIVLIIFGYTIK